MNGNHIRGTLTGQEICGQDTHQGQLITLLYLFQKGQAYIVC